MGLVLAQTGYRTKTLTDIAMGSGLTVIVAPTAFIQYPSIQFCETSSMQPEIKRHDPETEYLIPEGCHITELSNTGSDPALSIALARVLPGETTRWHSVKDTSERYVILSGEGRVEIGDLPPQRLHPHDVALIPAGCRQRITNTGDTDLIFLALCTPRFEAGNYEDRENHGH